MMMTTYCFAMSAKHFIILTAQTTKNMGNIKITMLTKKWNIELLIRYLMVQGTKKCGENFYRQSPPNAVTS